MSDSLIFKEVAEIEGGKNSVALETVLSIGGVLAALGFSARWNWWRPSASGIPILMYHKIGTPPPGSQLKKLWVSNDQFRRQLTYLKKNNYHPLTFFEMTDLLDNEKPLPEKPVIITLDDGYANNYENAFPLLKEFNFKAVIFLVVNAMGKDNFWHDPSNEIRIPMLSWEQVLEMQKWGIEMGSHTMNHSRLSTLSIEDVKKELKESRDQMEKKCGRAPVSFANPYGNAQDNLEIQKLIKQAGYRWSSSVHQGLAHIQENPYCLHRIFVRGDDFDYDFHLNLTRGRARL